MKINVDYAGNPWIIDNQNQVFSYDYSEWIFQAEHVLDISLGGSGAVSQAIWVLDSYG